MKQEWEMTDEEYAAFLRHKDEWRYLEFADMVQIGSRAIHEARDLRERLAKAEEDAAKWRDLAMGATSAGAKATTDLVFALASGALVKSDDPEKCKAALDLMSKGKA